MKKILYFLFAAIALMFAGCEPPSSAVIASDKTEYFEWKLTEDGTLIFTCDGPLELYSFDDTWSYYWEKINTVVLGDGVTTVSNLFQLLYNFEGITRVVLGKDVNDGRKIFTECYRMVDIEVVAENSRYALIDGVLFNKEKTELVAFPSWRSGEYVIPDEVTRIGNSAFGGCDTLSDITIPSSVTSIGNGAFSNCSMIEGITIPSGVKIIEPSTFGGCSSLSEMIIPQGVTEIKDGAFAYCEALTEITIPNSLTSIGKAAFQGCKTLSSMIIPDSVTEIGEWAFSYCEALSEVSFGKNVTAIGRGVLYYCKALTDVRIYAETLNVIGWGNALIEESYLPFCVTIVGSGESVLSGDISVGHIFHGVKEIIIGEGVLGISKNSRGYVDGAFSACYNLESVTISNDVTFIGSGTFMYCANLTDIVIPESVTEIGDNAFASCESLANVTIMATTPPTLSHGNFGYEGDVLYVPKGCVEEYKEDWYWNYSFDEIVEM